LNQEVGELKQENEHLKEQLDEKDMMVMEIENLKEALDE
jgi:hypothetical protein|tara:strand:- start:765 stop:881 length:117 start_codon:yes stop_codon:yes gene_type:complete